MRSYLHPTAPIAGDAVLTDDPKGAMDLAVALCDSPRMSNLAHGLWGYHGRTPEGRELTIQAIGIGGPSAAAVVTDLIRLGVDRLVRIGSCISLDPALKPGSVVVAGEVEPCDGVGRALCKQARMAPDAKLTRALLCAHGVTAGATVRSVDLYSGAPEPEQGIAALDLSSGAVAGAATSRGAVWACALVAAETAGGETLGDDDLHAALLASGKRAGTLLGSLPQAPGP